MLGLGVPCVCVEIEAGRGLYSVFGILHTLHWLTGGQPRRAECWAWDTWGRGTGRYQHTFFSQRFREGKDSVSTSHGTRLI